MNFVEASLRCRLRLLAKNERAKREGRYDATISRYSIILGKIIGGSFIASVEVIGVLVFGLVMGVHFSLFQLLMILVSLPILCLLGGAFGVFVLSLIGSKAATNQIFPLLFFPQFFLAGIFSPIKNLPFYLLIPSRAVPMTYAVDFLRSLFYAGTPEYDKIVIFPTWLNLSIVGAFFLVFLSIGTVLFVKREREK